MSCCQPTQESTYARGSSVLRVSYSGDNFASMSSVLNEWLFSEMPYSRGCDEFSERLQIVLFTLGDLELNAVYDACPGGKSWDEVPGQTGSGKKFHRNVISGVDFTAGCSRSGAGLYVPRRTLSQGNDVIRSPPPGFDEGSYQGQSVPAPSQICHNLSLAKQHEEKVTCAS